MGSSETLTPRGLLKAAIADVAQERELDPALIEGHSRKLVVLDARATVATRLYHQGLSPKRIARLMKRPERSVLTLLRRMQRSQKLTSRGEDDDRQAGTEGSPV